MIYTYSEYPTTTIYLHEARLKVPRGFTVGALVTRPGRNYFHVTRNSDGATVLCPLTPAASEVLPLSEMRAALHEACDAAAAADLERFAASSA